MLHRDHLIDRLSAGRNSRLIVVSGTAGSGKTSLVCQWIKRDNLCVAWYSLDKADNESDVFFRYLLTLLCNLNDEASAILKPLLQGHGNLAGTYVVPLLIRALMDLTHHAYLVLDDYHVIQSSRIHDALSYLLSHLPPKMHVVITSRYAIPFSLSNLRIRNQLSEISSQEIRFTEEETAKFFKRVIPVCLSGDQIGQLVRYTEGWVGGLQLFGLSFRGKESTDGLSDILNRVCHEATDYLVDEIINVQPPKVRTFLQTTALLDRFNADLCREVTGLAETAPLLDHSYRNDLFLISLDTEGIWYRYHHLFSDAVRKRMKVLHGHQFSKIQQKAALWFVRNHYLEDAFQHAFASEDFDFAADLLEDHLVSLYERSEIISSLRWLQKVPHEVLARRPLLRFQQCVMRMSSLQLSDIELALEGLKEPEAKAFRQYRGPKKEFSMGLFSFLTQVLPYYREPTSLDAAGLDALNDVFQSVSSDNRILSVFAKVVIAKFHILRGDLSHASDLLKEITVMTPSPQYVWTNMIRFRMIADVERWRGRLRQSGAVLEEAFVFLEHTGLRDSPLKPMLHLPIAWLAYYHNDLEKALEFANDALEYAKRFRMAQDILDSGFLVFLVHIAKGNAEKARQTADEMRWASRTTGSRDRMAFADAAMAHMAMVFGDMKSIERWLSEQQELSTDKEFSVLSVFRWIVQSKALCRLGRYHEAVGILQAVRKRCAERNMIQSVLDIDFLYSATLYALNRREQAKRTIERALSLAEGEGYARPCIDFGPSLFPVLNEIARSSSGGHRLAYLRNLLDVCAPPDCNGVSHRERNDKGNQLLTPREIEILRLLADGYRYREIAEKAFVSLDTVRTHSRHIFEKLGVNTRIHAIRRAEELQLLSDR
jgi:LuxR family maltose regulon positive regulatory protein